MKNTLISLLLLISILSCGCGQARAKKEILAQIDGYEITKDEFEQEFRQSVFGRADTQEARRDFLDNLIDRKLILKDAQAQDLDKEPAFLKMIEKFWEQSLLKLALDKKVREVSGSISVSEREIGDLYDVMLKSGKTDKTLEQIRNQLKQEITKQKEAQAVNDWMSRLRRSARIEISTELFKRK